MSAIPPVDSNNPYLQALHPPQTVQPRSRGKDEATETNHSPAEDAAEQVIPVVKASNINVKPVNQTFNSLA